MFRIDEKAATVTRRGDHYGPRQSSEKPFAEPNLWFSPTPNRPLRTPRPKE
jgi:hypothetical protein